MAGAGSRFSNAGYKTHKPLIRFDEKTLIRHSVESLDIKGDYIFVCRDLGGSYIKELKTELDKCKIGKYEIKIIDKMTSGAAETALLGLDSKYKGELIITNCDQYLDWDANSFLQECKKHDGFVLTYSSTNVKNSFVDVDKKTGKVKKMLEKPKKAPNDKALVGVHYWKNAQDFIKSVKLSLKNYKKGIGETYVSETYNYMIKDGKKIGYQHDNGRYWSTGTPEDFNIFKGIVAEYYTKKNNTYFIDLDGTIFKHAHKYSDLQTSDILLPGVKETLNTIDSRGDTIILVSARKESSRKLTEEILQKHMVPYDQLILGVAQGVRIVVNDILNDFSPERAKAVNVITDKGWNDSDLD